MNIHAKPKSPLVTCILAVRSDSRAVWRAVHYFRRQDYEPRELIVVDGGKSSIADALPPGNNIRYLQYGPQIPAAEMLDLARREARGEVIAHWDERAWYASDYLSHVVSKLVRETADICGPTAIRYCETESADAWQVETQRDQRWVFPLAAACYRSSVRALVREGELSASSRDKVAVFPDSIRLVLFAPPPVLADPRWRKRSNFGVVRDALGGDWRSHNPTQLRPLPATPDPIRYDPQSAPIFAADEAQLVSCILRANDKRLTALAIHSFSQQNYEPRELIVIHTGDFVPAPSGPEGASRIRYVTIPQNLSSGAALNLGCEYAEGEVLVQWEDADWHSPDCLRRMAERLVAPAAPADVCVFNPAFAFDSTTELAWVFERPIESGLPQRGALGYRRAFWAANRFPDSSHHDETQFVTRAEPGRVVSISGAGYQVRPIRSSALFSERLQSAYWRLYPTAEILRTGGPDWNRYLAEAPSAIPAVSPNEAAEQEKALVSCILIVGQRREFLAQSIRYFLRQDYPSKELIILDDNSVPFRDAQLLDSRIRYIRLEHPVEIAAQWITGCEQAQGDILLHWDSDAWYASDRIRRMCEPVVSGIVDVVALDAILFCNAKEETASRNEETEADQRRFHASSICYRRFLWPELQFPAGPAEDRVTFSGPAGLARLARIDGAAIQVVMSHGVQRAAGEAITSANYVRNLLGDDWTTYIARSPLAITPTTVMGSSKLSVPAGSSNQPFVSCIMPTYNRRKFVPLAIQYFLRQDYANRELIIVDDGSDPVEDLVPSDSRIRYIRLDGKASVGAKRNLACANARGEIIQHWDDDDWQAPNRVRYMVEGLQTNKAELCGINPFLAYDLTSGQAWLYRYPYAGTFWVAGTSLCYLRRLWERRHFEDIDVGEDNQFVWNSPASHMVALPGLDPVVCIIHRQNVSPKYPPSETWDPYPVDDLRKILGADWETYEFFDKPRVIEPERTEALNLGPSKSFRAVVPVLPPSEPPRPASSLLDLANWERSRQQADTDVRDSREPLANRLAPLGKTLLDIGCGPGTTWRHLLQQNLSIVGVDMNPALLSIAHTLFPSSPSCCADAVSLPFHDRSFDIVLCRHVLEFSSNSIASGILTEASRVARSAVVLAFYGALQGAVAEELATLLNRAGWSIGERSHGNGADAQDEVWIARRMEGA